MLSPNDLAALQAEILGRGPMRASSALERAFQFFTSKVLILSALALVGLTIPITLDVVMRTLTNSSVFGLLDVENIGLIMIAFLSIGSTTVHRGNMSVDIVFNIFSQDNKLRLVLLAQLVTLFFSLVLGWYTFGAAMEESSWFISLGFPKTPVILLTTFGLLCVGIATCFQFFHSLRERLMSRDYLGILLVFAVFFLLVAAPFLYKAASFKLSTLAVGGIGFLLVFCLLMARVPLGMAMGFMGLMGLYALMRTPAAVEATVGLVPYVQCSDFIFLALPMFMLMGEMISLSGLSKDLFDCAHKWLGTLPGGLAVASIGGCAGFGAVSGDSLSNVATMSAVALPAMRERGYDTALATGAIAAGGTLGILIPPSSGFIIFSILTEVSVGKLFTAGILPGLLLTSIFMSIVMLRVKLNPTLAPASQGYSLKEKIISLKGLLPVAFLFVVVVGGIMTGTFTPGEGGATGALIAMVVALVRGKLTIREFTRHIIKAANLAGAIFVLLIGVFIFGVFLTTSHLPALLAEFVVNMNTNRYIILIFVLILYILLGFVMNVQPMMMLTLPSIFPTIAALGFDGVWFGVLTVIVMEMGLITPPVGLNVFTLAAAAPDIPVSTIFRGVMPFFFGMLLCTVLIILFPQIALFLGS